MAHIKFVAGEWWHRPQFLCTRLFPSQSERPLWHCIHALERHGMYHQGQFHSVVTSSGAVPYCSNVNKKKKKKKKKTRCTCTWFHLWYMKRFITADASWTETLRIQRLWRENLSLSKWGTRVFARQTAMTSQCQSTIFLKLPLFCLL